MDFGKHQIVLSCSSSETCLPLVIHATDGWIDKHTKFSGYSSRNILFF